MEGKKCRLVKLFIIYCSVILHLTNAEADFQSGSVYCKDTKCSFRPNVLDWKTATSVGTFNDTLLTTGWATLDITAGAGTFRSSNNDVMYAAGYLEGIFTAKKIELQFTNVFDYFFPPPVDQKMVEKVKQWFVQQREWSERMIKEYSLTHPVWRHMKYVTSQLDGLYAGYRSVRNGSQALDQFAFSFLNANGDMFDIPKAINRSYMPDWTQFTLQEARQSFYTSGHCSALIKMLPGFENMFISHVTWNTYQATNRIYKHYDLRVDDPNTAAWKMSFPSYPGYLESLDDLYVMDSGLVAIETTNQIFDKTLYDKVKVDSLLCWQRVRLANMMARDGKEWATYFDSYNSGTYNNQYMILDLKKFKPKSPLPDGTLWIAEQIPGLIVSGDQTEILRAGYWPSYNVPFFEEIYNKSGYPAYVAAHGPEFSYQLAPRARIFRRDEGKVTDMESMKKLMRYNDYKHDPYSGGSVFGAICGRGDLDKTTPRAFGCYDAKVFDFAMAKSLEANIVSGPTLGAGFQPFSWSGPFDKVSHVGLPHTYDFNFIQTKPRFQDHY